ncbi:hypothetical protein [Mesorhizobium sp. M0847]|uniref:hypothetical protein n=1 Tax=unclassified Mesorhizobium TaxID=325217 RepID=UPI00333A6BF1
MKRFTNRCRPETFVYKSIQETGESLRRPRQTARVQKADIRVELAGRWTKGMTVCNFEKMGGMHHFGGTASEQTDFRHTVAVKLDHAKFCDLIVAALGRFV